jgi:crossover junction endodeoxyribonuclease RuvC
MYGFKRETGLGMAQKEEGRLRILGIDPGLVITGYGIIDASRGRPGLVEAGVVRVPTKLPLPERLSTLFFGLQEIFTEYSPDVVSLEEVHTQYERPRVAVMMGHARGVICLAAALSQVPVFSYAPTHIKSALTGNGRAPKEQIRRMVQVTLGLKVAPEPLDVSDALAAALCHLARADRTSVD